MDDMDVQGYADARFGPVRDCFADVALRLTGMLQDGVLVAHNAPFDVAFLAAEYKRAGLAMPEVSAICTLRLARRLGLEVASLSLVDCCAHFGIPHQRRHRADEFVGDDIGGGQPL